MPTILRFDVTVASQPDGAAPDSINSVDLIFGAESLLEIDPRFDYAPAFLAELLGPPLPPFPCDPGPCVDFYIGGAFRRPQSSPLALGTLSVRAPADLVEGRYRVFVDSDLDQFSRLNGKEGLFGEAFIDVVPEPTTLALLAGGILATSFSRRRFSFRA